MFAPSQALHGALIAATVVAFINDAAVGGALASTRADTVSRPIVMVVVIVGFVMMALLLLGAFGR